MPAMIILSRTGDSFFGSRDTIISKKQDSIKDEALVKIRLGPLEDEVNDSVVDQELERKLEGKELLFSHWNPYAFDDGAAEEYRQRYRSRHELYGWPFDDG